MLIHRVGQKWGHRLITIILSILNRFFKKIVEDSMGNLQLNGYQKSNPTALVLMANTPQKDG